jgi:predicted nuclease of restriction endonuclease-like (RecB) superfamily
MLRSCRSFFLCYPQISQPVVGELAPPGMPFSISQPLYGNLEASADVIATRSKRRLTQEALPSLLSPEQLARISWTHFLELIRIEDPWKRAFYENELLQGHWSKRQLQRQIGSLLYERTALSTNKRAQIERARKQEPPETIAEMMRDPYILEFTGLSERPEYSEDELEAALLDHLQRFLLELGRGFCFEARQFRMTEGRKHHRVDLVFYHRILRCHVLIDLKIRAFKPEDAGQMNFYVNWFKANMMQKGGNPPVGILLCSDKDGTEVEFATAGMDQKLFVSRYLVALPSVEKLRRFLEADRERIESQMPPPKARKRAPRKPKS